MTSKLSALCLALVLVIAPTAARGGRAAAQTTTAAGSGETWVLVKLVPVGDTLTVKLKNGKSLEGEKQDTTDATLSLLRMGRIVELQRAEIQKVYRRLPDESAGIGPRGIGGAALGVAFGLAAFGVLNAGDSGRSREEQRRYTTLTALLVPAGAAVGFFAERAIKQVQSKDLIYEAK